MSRFIDGYRFSGKARSSQPATLNMLLNQLGVDFASPDEQRAAVERWCEANVPGPRLAAEIERTATR